MITLRASRVTTTIAVGFVVISETAFGQSAQDWEKAALRDWGRAHAQPPPADQSNLLASACNEWKTAVELRTGQSGGELLETYIYLSRCLLEIGDYYGSASNIRAAEALGKRGITSEHFDLRESVDAIWRQIPLVKFHLSNEANLPELAVHIVAANGQVGTVIDLTQEYEYVGSPGLEVEVSAPGYSSQRVHVEGKPGTVQVLQIPVLKRIPLPDPEPPPPEDDSGTVVESEPSSGEKVGAGMVGVGALATILGLGLAGGAGIHMAIVDEQCKNSCSPDDIATRKGDYPVVQEVGWWMAGIGGGIALTGVLIWGVAGTSRRNSDPSIAPMIGFGSIGVKGVF